MSIVSSTIKTVGQRIRALRQKNGLTQEILAEKAELHYTYIGQVERGEKNLTINTLEKILRVLDISFSDFFQVMGMQSEEKTIPMECYEIIYELDLENQKRALRILKEIKAISDD